MDQCIQRTQPPTEASLKALSSAPEPALSDAGGTLSMSVSGSSIVGDLSTQQSSDVLSHYASKAMKKALRKMCRHQKAVLKDTDIEALHQMRIGLRRLRTTIVTFEQVLAFPDSVKDVALKPLAKRLGRVRDLDVLLLTLRDRHRPLLPKKERKALDRIVRTLHTKRDRQFKRMKRFLLSDQYQAIKKSVRHWSQVLDPAQNTSAAAAWSLPAALPDLLLPVLSQTLLHPGWLAVPQEVLGGQGEEMAEAEAIALVNQWLDQEGIILHDLRKQMKQLRYQADFFAPQYDAAYSQQIKDFKVIQDILGTFQDTWVLAQTLRQLDGASWTQRLPSMYEQMQQDRWQTWKQWETIREQYITVEMRSHLRQMMLTPLRAE